MTVRLEAAALALVAALLAAAPALTQTVDLPPTVATPGENPRPDPEAGEKQALPESPGEAPLPSTSPERQPEPTAPEPSPEAADGAKAEDPPPSALVPDPRPEDAQEGPAPDSEKQPEKALEEAAPMPTDPRSTMPIPTEPPAAELACRERLKALDVTFETRPTETDPSGCSMPWPVSISTLGKGLAIAPDALVNCATAEAAARFAQKVLKSETRAAFSVDLQSVRQVSGYVCRPRASQDKLSEHAFGNAIDLGGFVLADGREIAVTRSDDLSTSRFLARVRAAACGPFKTVLGPGSDADHADHFHLDLAERRNGSAYCR